MKKEHWVWFVVIVVAVVVGGWILRTFIMESERLAWENRPKIGFQPSPELATPVPPQTAA